MTKTVRWLLGAAAVAAAACAGCAPSQVYFRPEGMNVVAAGAELGRRFYVPPEAGKDGCELSVTTDGARVVRRETGQRVAAVRVRLGVRNRLGQPVAVQSAGLELVDSRGVRYPASYVAPSGVGEGGEVGPGSNATIEVYFELGPLESAFQRFEPERYYYHDPWWGPWYDPWPFWWGGAIIIHHHSGSGSSGVWGP
jgi:hypothetical protein